MAAASLVEIAQQLSAPGKGLLASDESTPTIGRPGINTRSTVLQMPLTTTPSCTVKEMLLQDRLWLHSATITAQHLKVPHRIYVRSLCQASDCRRQAWRTPSTTGGIIGSCFTQLPASAATSAVSGHLQPGLPWRPPSTAIKGCVGCCCDRHARAGSDGPSGASTGAILYKETLAQSSSEGIPFVDCLARQGILPGIKVDEVGLLSAWTCCCRVHAACP